MTHETTPYRYMQPGRDDFRVEAMGFAHGIDVHPQMLFEQLPPGAPLPVGYLSNMPTSSEEVEALSQELAENFTKFPDVNAEMPLTPSPALFIEHYAKSFAEGYRFGLFAGSRGLFKLLYSVPRDEIYSCTFAFAWELKLKEPAIDTPENDRDRLIMDAVEKIQAIYKQYRRLN